MSCIGSARLAGKVVLVTGASGGLGAAIVVRLAREGAQVVAADIAAPDMLNGTMLDVTNEAQWIAVLDDTVARFGRIDGLVNNAGINLSDGGENPETFEIADLRRMMAVNFEGAALGCKHVMPHMARDGGGSIVNMSSVAALLPADFIAAYAVSKTAVEQWTRSVASHCARHGYAIRCNSVHPGQVLTPMMDVLWERMSVASGMSAAQLREDMLKIIPMGVFQEPVDIANAVLFLLSDESRYVTGTQMVVDGGMLLTN